MSICWYIGTKYTSVCIEVLSTLAVLCVGYFIGCIASRFRGYCKMKQENARLRSWIGVDRCGNCRVCGDESEPDPECPFAGEPDGCNNRDCREYVLRYGRD